MPRFCFSVCLALLSSSAFAADSDKKGMPQLDPTSYASQLFWLAVFFVLFYLFMSSIAMPRLRGIIMARQSRITGDLGQATSDAAEAQRLKAELDARLATARDEARGVIATATEAAREKAAKQDAALSADLAKRIASAEASIAAARTQAMAAVADIAAGMVEAIVGKLAPVPVNAAEARETVSHFNRKEA